ncbi:GNAT family N-acetyltransferase [Foetidibacter luteolus]|uniref:GNAT family N-acetyltransferase n=1 Tax=Foetidibacter luteolus TaxID=2608880 RepID=UPI00129AE693|nr:GNAT family N-acetyltransferase [Foetidibacter luteolus]
MSIIVRPATEKDFPAILSLTKELAVFQQTPERVTNTVELMLQEKQYFNGFVAENETGETVGMATYFFAYYTWVGKSLYLDDLYVKQEYRGSKIGSLLLKKIFETARLENCKRVRWQVSDWNKPAIEFYKKCGAELDEECINCDFDEHAIKAFNL